MSKAKKQQEVAVEEEVAVEAMPISTTWDVKLLGVNNDRPFRVTECASESEAIQKFNQHWGLRGTLQKYVCSRVEE